MFAGDQLVSPADDAVIEGVRQQMVDRAAADRAVVLPVLELLLRLRTKTGGILFGILLGMIEWARLRFSGY